MRSSMYVAAGLIGLITALLAIKSATRIGEAI
jgi:hypothetical protein